MKRILVLAAVLSFFALLGRTTVLDPAAAANAEYTRLSFKGTAQAPEMYSSSYPIMSLSASGSGNATELGQFALVYQGEIDLTDLSTVESAQFVGLNGNSINATGVGQATEATTPGILNLVQIYKVSGGTGRFADARGTITLTRIVNITSGLTYSTFEGYLLIPVQE